MTVTRAHNQCGSVGSTSWLAGVFCRSKNDKSIKFILLEYIMESYREMGITVYATYYDITATLNTLTFMYSKRDGFLFDFENSNIDLSILRHSYIRVRSGIMSIVLFPANICT